jgi:hypothetical protein
MFLKVYLSDYNLNVPNNNRHVLVRLNLVEVLVYGV